MPCVNSGSEAVRKPYSLSNLKTKSFAIGQELSEATKQFIISTQLK